MRSIFSTLLAALAIGLVGAAGFIWFGVYDVSATRPHWPLSYWVMEEVRLRSVKARAVGITSPPDMATDANVLAGVEHYAAHCATCHGAPGVPPGDIAAGLYPKPADLRDSTRRYSPAELFWIVKNGIKMSGMPAWQDHSDGELWATVAFIEKLPEMSEEDYRRLVMESIMHGGEHHHAIPMDHSTIPGMVVAPASDHQH